MSRSFRGRPEPDDTESELENDEPSVSSPHTGSWQDRMQSLQKYGRGEKLSVDPSQVDIGKRLVAALIDIAAGYLIGLVFNVIPFINIYFNAQVIMLLYLICRDALFNGRGIGKNLMGLQVVDMKTGQPATLIQSVKRNMVLYGPPLVLYLLMPFVAMIPDETLNSIADNAIKGFGGLYAFIVIPYEAYRAYSRTDGLRWGDDLAGTAIVLADMDFSGPQKK